MDLEAVVRSLTALPPATFALAAAAAAFVEYVFPPFPGDAVVVGATAVAVAGGGSVPAVFAATTVGAVAGAAVDLWAGRRLARTAWRERLGPARAAHVDRAVAAMERRGAWVLLGNRFVPGVRALFFVAAGVAGVPWVSALLASAVSALAWNAVLVGVGTAAGWNLPVLGAWLGRYSLAVGALLVGLPLAFWLRSRVGRRAEGE